jgi:hypothetical protein
MLANCALKRPILANQMSQFLFVYKFCYFLNKTSRFILHGNLGVDRFKCTYIDYVEGLIQIHTNWLWQMNDLSHSPIYIGA